MTQRTDASERYAELRRLAELATPGPWREGIDGNQRLYAPDNLGDDSGLIASFVRRKDLSYIAAVNPQALLALLADNKALREALEPFARLTPPDHWEPHEGVNVHSSGWITVADISRARAALASALHDPKENKT